MFKFLKNKLKNAISNIGKKVEKEVKDEEIEIKDVKNIEPIEEKLKEEKKGFFARFKKEEKHKEDKEEIKEKETKKKTIIEEKLKEEEVIEKKEKADEIKAGPEIEIKEIITEPKEDEKRSFFSKIKEKIITKKISEEKFEELFFDLEVALLENNVAIEVVEKIRDDLKKEIVDKPILRGKVEEVIKEGLKSSIDGLFLDKNFDFIKEIKKKKLYVILFLGINGSGKTTTIAKVAYMLKENKLKVVLGAADTFRAASIEQLKSWGDKLGIKTIAHNYGSDPAAVAFDAKKYAEAHDIDVVLIDTAGRLQSNKNLMEEIKKIDRVVKPDMKVFVGEAITGNDCIEQAKSFNDAVNLDGIILTKMDVDEKGGAFISATFVTKKPILLVGNGQNLKDIKELL
ncbi:signal recognition particle-docking protein FtsY [Candidatus Woesearchaeota archaeon]|nr:signal recognition particle-docking protein FtsY [Candidatus Woesearchaeota archaeon]